MAQATWDSHRYAFAYAADRLRDRLDNILSNRLFEAYASSESYVNEVILSTLYRFGDYFGWSEIIRRELRAPNPEIERHTRRTLLSSA